MQFWQEEKDNASPYSVPEDIVDLSFRVSCQTLPLDHAHALSSALLEALPWLRNEAGAGIHLIHGAESGNGWIRPEGPDDVLYLSRRTRLTLRLPHTRLEDATRLSGDTLDVAGNALTLGETSVRNLSALTTIFSRYVTVEDTDADDEMAFLQAVTDLLAKMGIRAPRMMAGRVHSFRLPREIFAARSLMLDGLETEESVRLQQEGLGGRRLLGCGLFLPHKGIEAVRKPNSQR
jgi:CRISPR-associated protein Cas6